MIEMGLKNLFNGFSNSENESNRFENEKGKGYGSFENRPDLNQNLYEVQDININEDEAQKYHYSEELGDFKINLSLEEKLTCLHEINDKFKKILYVYDRSLEPDSGYKYKIYCGGIAIYVSSSNMLFNGELVSLIINLNAILTNEFDKPQIKRLVFESINFIEYLISKYESLYNSNNKLENSNDKLE